MRYASILPAGLLFFLIFGSTAQSETFSIYGKGIEKKDLERLLNENRPGPGEDLRAVLLHRTDEASVHLVLIRTKEKPHLHRSHDLIVTQKRGAGILHIEKETVAMIAGDSVFIPRGVVHYFENTSEELAAAFAVFTPPYDGSDLFPVTGPTPVETPPDVPEVKVIGHSYRIEEEWPRIQKTKYSWKATVRNDSDVPQSVTAYHTLMDDEGYPLARNMAARVVPPHETAEIVSDSYVENGQVSRIKSGRVVLKSKPKTP